jgi:biotin transporter BioY
VLAVIFAIASVVILTMAHLGAPPVAGGVGGLGGFLLTVGTAFGYAAGWTPYAAAGLFLLARRSRSSGRRR